MQKVSMAMIWMLVCTGAAFAGPDAGPDKAAERELTAKLGERLWSKPETRLVRATTYKKQTGAPDSNSAKGKSSQKIGLQYASKKEAGTLAVPDWLPRGSLVKIPTRSGTQAYIAADQGRAIENRKAAKKLGKTKEENAAPVLDFCAPHQSWPDFVKVEIYYYAGKIPFEKLTLENQKTLFAFAMAHPPAP